MKKIKSSPFLPRKKRGFFWFLLFALIFLLYYDFWGGEGFEPLIGGWLPAWFLYLMTLIVAYSLIAFFFTKKYWPAPSLDLIKSSSKKKSRQKE